MEYVIQGFAPKRLFEQFEELSAIPRGSGNEAAAADFLLRFAKEHRLEAHRDEYNNVVLKKPGSNGAEQLPAVMLQGHLDMVCEKNADVRHDFAAEGIRLVQQGNLLRADGTTLGADNGVAVALMLALLEEDTLVHPPLECVFTTEEETGLTGARMLDGSLLSARTMINLDSEEEGIATVSCAGGMRVELSRPCGWEAAPGTALALQIGGLLGGHSGVDIDRERGNANRLMGRILDRIAALGAGFRICGIEGGCKDNAIPRECRCLLLPDSDADADRILEAALAEAEVIHAELAATEPDFRLNAEPIPVERAMCREAGDALRALLFLAPNGVQSRNASAGNFVVSSLNLGVVRAEESVNVTFSLRSSVESQLELLRRRVARLGERLGFAVEISSAYPGWAYREQSPIRTVFQECCRELTGQELQCEAIHAGLECGIFCQKLPGLDAIAIGPAMTGVHTPDETLDLASLERTYRLLCRVLERLADGAAN